MAKLLYIHTAEELVELLLALGNPKGLARMVADEFMEQHDVGTAYEWPELKEEISKAARSVVSKAVSIGLKDGRLDIGVDEDGDLSIM